MRVRRDWTQEALSEKLRLAGWTKCKRSWLARIETGEVGVKDLHLAFLREVFGEEFEVQFWEAVSASRKEPSVFSPLKEERGKPGLTALLLILLLAGY
jgi:transcriptional regulator with XRE-family HTH domain